MINTWSKFIYGTTVTQSNYLGDFNEGAADLLASLTPGSFTLGELCLAIQTALNQVGGQIYTVALDRATGLVTISAAGNFELLIGTGANINFSFWSMLGFTGADLSGHNSYTGNLEAGTSYYPQFLLQSYIPPEINKMARTPMVNETATGRTELIRFGIDQIISFELKYLTDIPMDGVVIKNNPAGIAAVTAFFDGIIDKSRFEFVPDVNTPATIYKVLLDTTESYKDGTGFRLKELFMQNLPGMYETGVVTLRVVT